MVDVIRERAAPVIALGRRYGIAIAVGLLVVFAVIFLLNGRDEIVDAVQLLGAVSPVWIVVLAGLQLLIIGTAAVIYKILLRRQGYRIGILTLAEIHLRRVLVGAVTPLGGPASLYVFIRSLRPYGVSGDDALITASIRSVAGIVGFLVFLVPGLLVQSPSTLILVASSVLVAGLTLLLSGGAMLLRAPDVPEPLERWLPGRVLEFIVTARAHRITALDFVFPVLAGFVAHVSTASLLYVGLRAVGFEPVVGTVLIGYVIGKLFFMMAPMFQGIGLVEFGMALALQRAGVPPAVAVSAALLYRVGDLWLPLSWAFLIQLVRAPVVSHARHWVAPTRARPGERSTQMPSRSAAAASQVYRLGQLVLILAATLQFTSVSWVAVAAGLLLIA